MVVTNNNHDRMGIVARGWRNFITDRELVIWGVAFLVVCISFSLFTVYDQITERTKIEFLLTKQLKRHRDVISGTSIDPWQYRILGDYVVAAAIRVVRWVGLSSPELKAFAIVRVLQNFLVFVSAGLYWRCLGIKRLHTLFALAFFAWGIAYSGYGSGLAFSTYFDILFFLLAALIILSERYLWLIPVIVLAALNRETSGLIPFMLIAAVFQPKAWRKTDRRVIVVAVICLAIYALEYGALRLIFGPRPLMKPYGEELGLNLLIYNLTSAKSYSFVFATLSIIPLVALFYWKQWPTVLQRFFWAIVPVWFGVHLFLGVVAEARLLLVPQAVVFIPAAFLVVQKESV